MISFVYFRTVYVLQNFFKFIGMEPMEDYLKKLYYIYGYII